MSYSTRDANDFFCPSGELVPAEDKVGTLHKGLDFFHKPNNVQGSTVDEDGLYNIHAVEAMPFQSEDDTFPQKIKLSFIYAIATFSLIGLSIAVTYFAG